MTEYGDGWPDMRAEVAGNAFTKIVERMKLLSDEKQKNRQFRVKLFRWMSGSIRLP